MQQDNSDHRPRPLPPPHPLLHLLPLYHINRRCQSRPRVLPVVVYRLNPHRAVLQRPVSVHLRSSLRAHSVHAKRFRIINRFRTDRHRFRWIKSDRHMRMRPVRLLRARPPHPLPAAANRRSHPLRQPLAHPEEASNQSSPPAHHNRLHRAADLPRQPVTTRIRTVRAVVIPHLLLVSRDRPTLQNRPHCLDPNYQQTGNKSVITYRDATSAKARYWQRDRIRHSSMYRTIQTRFDTRPVRFCFVLSVRCGTAQGVTTIFIRTNSLRVTIAVGRVNHNRKHRVVRLGRVGIRWQGRAEQRAVHITCHAPRPFRRTIRLITRHSSIRISPACTAHTRTLTPTRITRHRTVQFRRPVV